MGRNGDLSSHVGTAFAVVALTLASVIAFGATAIGLLGTAIASIMFWKDGSWREAGPQAIVFGVMFLSWSLPLSALLSWVHWKLWFAAWRRDRRLGPVRIELDPPRPRAGGPLVVRVRLRPRAQLRTGDGDVELLGAVQEKHWLGLRQPHRERKPIDTRRDLAVGEKLVAEATFVLPPAALEHWIVRARVAVERAPPWEEIVGFTVLPVAS